MVKISVLRLFVRARYTGNRDMYSFAVKIPIMGHALKRAIPQHTFSTAKIRGRERRKRRGYYDLPNAISAVQVSW